MWWIPLTSRALCCRSLGASLRLETAAFCNKDISVATQQTGAPCVVTSCDVSGIE